MSLFIYNRDKKNVKKEACLKCICILACFGLLSFKGSFVGGKKEGGLHLAETVGNSIKHHRGILSHKRTQASSSLLDSSSQSSVVWVNSKHLNGVYDQHMQHYRFQDNNQKWPFQALAVKYGSNLKSEWKDTVCPREEGPSSEKFSHDAAHWPNVHWFIQWTKSTTKWTSYICIYKIYRQKYLSWAILWRYLSCCSASNSAWSLELCTTAWRHNQSFHHLCALPNRNPRSVWQTVVFKPLV